MNKNFEDLYVDIADENFDIIAPTETRLKEGTDDLYSDFQCYEGIFRSRTFVGAGGGVGILIRKLLSFQCIEEMSFVVD